MVAPIVIWAALVAASALANNQAQKKVESAQNKAYNAAERNRLSRQSEAEQAARNTEAQYKDQPKKMEETGDTLGEQFKAEQEDVSAAMARSALRPGLSTDAVVGEESRQRSGTRRYTDKLADALGQMRGVDQEQMTAALAGSQNARDIQNADAAVRGDQGVLAARLQAAQGKGKGYATLGDVLSLAATVYGGYAFGGAAGAAGKGAAAGAGGGGAGSVLGSQASSTPYVAKALPMF